MNILPRCVGRCRDNTQCSRRVTDGSQPPLCHLHNGTPSASPIISDEVDEMKILKRLARDANPQVRLRAVDLLIGLRKKDEKGCPTCADKLDQDRRITDLIARCTDAQRDQLRALLAPIRALKLVIATQPLNGDDSNV